MTSVVAASSGMAGDDAALKLSRAGVTKRSAAQARRV
jgi:hypothetical protein